MINIPVIPGKVWTTQDETIAPADLDAAAQPIAQIMPHSITTASFYTPGVLANIATAGGPGLRGDYTTPLSTSVPINYTALFGSLIIAGAMQGDLVIVEGPTNLALFYVGYVDAAKKVQLSAFNFTTGTAITLPFGSYFKVMVYSQ